VSKPRSEDDIRRLKALGQAIRAIRKTREISQEALANTSQMDRSHLGRVERGERNVTALNLFRIADALGVHPAEIFSNAELSTLV
jgi:transcriptional regulator with XRE-family HTH domain